MNKEGFKRHMRILWHPKANVVVTDLEDNQFAFGFNSKHERTAILRGGPWLYNKQYLVLLEELDSLTFPARIPLFFQEFWVQFKGIPLGYITRHMGGISRKFIGGLHTHRPKSQRRSFWEYSSSAGTIGCAEAFAKICEHSTGGKADTN